jgi:hypothetical protein
MQTQNLMLESLFCFGRTQRFLSLVIEGKSALNHNTSQCHKGFLGREGGRNAMYLNSTVFWRKHSFQWIIEDKR